jgi:hypothetical protein
LKGVNREEWSRPDVSFWKLTSQKAKDNGERDEEEGRYVHACSRSAFNRARYRGVCNLVCFYFQNVLPFVFARTHSPVHAEQIMTAKRILIT